MNTFKNFALALMLAPALASAQGRIPSIHADTAKIGGTPAVATSSIFDVFSTTKGVLLPRMTTTQRDAIATPATGLMIFNTTLGAFNFYDGATWTQMSSFLNPMTSNGDLITRAAGVPARLAIGASGTALTSDGTAASWNKIADANVASAAAIAVNKLAALTVTKVAITDGSGFLSTSTVTPTTLAFLDVGSSLTTLLGLKAPLASPTFTGTVTTPLSTAGPVITSAGGVLSSEANLAISRGGTGAGAKAAAFDALSPMTTKGDIPVYSSTGVRQGIGADGTVLTADSAQTNGLKWATAASAPSASYESSNCSIATSVSSNALTVALKDSAGSDPSGGSPCKIGFRSATSATGTYSQVSATAATSVVISSGSTLGCANAVACTLYVYAVNNAGTIVLAVGNNIMTDEGSVATTTVLAGSGADDAGNVLYSTAAQTSKAVRFLGRITITEATAGTWASNATEVSNLPSDAVVVMSATSSLKTPTGTPHFHTLTGGSLGLPPGIWELTGGGDYTTVTSSSGYAAIAVGLFGANGTDANSVPVGISTLSGVTVLSSTSPSGNLVYHLPASGTAVGAVGTLAAPLTIIRTTASTTTVYVVTYSAQTTAANARITGFITARRLQ